MTHAMVFTGVHVEKRSSNEKTSDDEKSQPNDLQFIRYRVENSHGDDKADKGYIIMSDEWFNEYLYEVVVDKKYLSKDVLAVLEQEPITLKAWDPMGALANFVRFIYLLKILLHFLFRMRSTIKIKCSID
jgi:bleomycin hydrolase